MQAADAGSPQGRNGRGGVVADGIFKGQHGCAAVEAQHRGGAAAGVDVLSQRGDGRLERGVEQANDPIRLAQRDRTAVDVAAHATAGDQFDVVGGEGFEVVLFEGGGDGRG